MLLQTLVGILCIHAILAKAGFWCTILPSAEADGNIVCCKYRLTLLKEEELKKVFFQLL